MLHAREDYNRIQDPEGKIPEDEPVFLLRAQDLLAPGIVATYAQIAEQAGCHEIAKLAREHVLRMIEWQAKGAMKLPDV